MSPRHARPDGPEPEAGRLKKWWSKAPLHVRFGEIIVGPLVVAVAAWLLADQPWKTSPPPLSVVSVSTYRHGDQLLLDVIMRNTSPAASAITGVYLHLISATCGQTSPMRPLSSPYAEPTPLQVRTTVTNLPKVAQSLVHVASAEMTAAATYSGGSILGGGDPNSEHNESATIPIGPTVSASTEYLIQTGMTVVTQMDESVPGDDVDRFQIDVSNLEHVAQPTDTSAPTCESHTKTMVSFAHDGSPDMLVVKNIVTI